MSRLPEGLSKASWVAAGDEDEDHNDNDEDDNDENDHDANDRDDDDT